MTIAYIGMGSNLGDPISQLNQGIDTLKGLSLTSVITISSFYKSNPIGPQNQPIYINAVAKIDTGLSAYDLLDSLQDIESRQKRVRKRRWGPRTLDMDILLYGKEIIADERLYIPHIEMHKRGFVLLPLYEIEQDIEIPDIGAVSTLLEQIYTSDMEKLPQIDINM